MGRGRALIRGLSGGVAGEQLLPGSEFDARSDRTPTGSDSAAVDGCAPPDRRPPLLAYAVMMAAFGGLFAPRLTRFLAAVFSALTISDFLQVAYKAAEQKGLR
jgi:hypothetical protein